MKLKNNLYYALFAALTALLSQISVPLPFTPVPINLALISVLSSGGILGAKGGTISQLIYVLIGAVGAPIFANFNGGIGILLGPTGGYIIGYILAAYVTGLLVNRFNKNIWMIMLSMTLGVILCYAVGTVCFIIYTKKTLISSLLLCVIPFIPGDILKIMVSAGVVKKIRKVKND